MDWTHRIALVAENTQTQGDDKEGTRSSLVRGVRGCKVSGYRERMGA